MLTPLADFMIALFELVEAEVKSARRGLVLLAVALIIGGFSGLMILGALGLLMWAFYISLNNLMSQPAALILCALTMLFIAGLSLCCARRIVR